MKKKTLGAIGILIALVLVLEATTSFGKTLEEPNLETEKKTLVNGNRTTALIDTEDPSAEKAKLKQLQFKEVRLEEKRIAEENEAEVEKRKKEEEIQTELAKQAEKKEAVKQEKSIKEMADEIINGVHGSGHANRQQSLGISETVYGEVKAEINSRQAVTQPTQQNTHTSSSNEQQESNPISNDGFNFHSYHFPVSTFSGRGGDQVPMHTDYVYQWTSKPSHYVVEMISPPGYVIQQLGMGDVVVLNGTSYVVTHIKRTVPNDSNSMAVLNSVAADITIQTCESTKGANGANDMTLWYLTAK